MCSLSFCVPGIRVRLDEEAGAFDGLEYFRRGGGRLERALFRRDAGRRGLDEQTGDGRVTRLDGPDRQGGGDVGGAADVQSLAAVRLDAGVLQDHRGREPLGLAGGVAEVDLRGTDGLRAES